jgi:hypothetical protein
MTFTEFLSILNGTWIEVAGTSAKNQCVDLANAYIKYVLGLPPIEWTNAVDFPSKAGDNYEYILNTPTVVPQEGDLVIWGGTHGHIAIFIEGDTKRFTSFDQNYPTVGANCHVQEHTYLSPKVLGWLRPKVSPVDYVKLFNEKRKECDNHWDFIIWIADTLNIPHDIDAIKKEIIKFLGYEKIINDRNKELEDKNKEIEKLKLEIEKIKNTHSEITEKVEDTNKEVVDVGTQISETSQKVEELSKNVSKKTLFDYIKDLFNLFHKEVG